MNKGIVISLCDRTGIMVQPWAQAGYECWCVDFQHQIRVPRKDGNINYVCGDARTWSPPSSRQIAFVSAFPDCTHVAGSGARDFPTKGGALLRDTIELFDACRSHAQWSGAPYLIENPVGVLSSVPHIGKPDHYFHPCDFAGYLKDPNQDAYTKKTCLWTGNGFVFPDRKPVDPIDGSKMWRMTPTDDRKDLRAATPQGFAKAVFEANTNQAKGGY